MRKTSFFGLDLPEYTNDADIEQLNTIFEFFESIHRDSVNFYKSEYKENLITLTSNGGKYPKEFVDNLSLLMSSPVDLKPGQAGVKVKIGTIGKGAEINLEVLNVIKAGDFCFIKYYLSENKFRVTSYYQDLKKAMADIEDIKNGYNFTGDLKVNGSTVLKNSNKSDVINSASSDTIATSKAVKLAYDKGVSGVTKADTAQKRADSGFSLAETKEPKITKKTGFNLDKSDSATSDSVTTLATSKAAKTAYDRGSLGISKADAAQTKANQGFTLADGKEPKFGKKTGFNLDKSDVVNSTSSDTLATSKAVKTAYDKGDSALARANDTYKKAEINTTFGNYYKKTEVNTTLGGYYKKTDKVANSVNSDKLAGKTHTSNGTANTIVSRDGSGNTNVNTMVCNVLNLGGINITIEK